MKNLVVKLIVAAFLIFNGLFVQQITATTQIDIPGPAGSGRFGERIVALPNGNIVVTDRQYNGVGAVYLYNGATGELIIRLREGFTQGIAALPNGNFVLTDLQFDAPGVPDVGAVYLYNGATGALISRLTGSSAFDYVGSVSVLPNGNYVVVTTGWDNGEKTDVGAVTVCSGTTGCEGVVSPANSLIGSTAGDIIGNQRLTVLTNGNFVVNSSGWINGATVRAGAVTLCNGTTGCVGVVSSANSLVGSTADEYAEAIALTNGNYVVNSPYWDNGTSIDAGAVTFCNGTSGCTGTRTSANSLVGSTTYDYVGIRGVVLLSNGNYVVSSPGWNNGASVDAGAVTFCNGTTGCVGVVSSANSLVGSTTNDVVGLINPIGTGVTALTNGNYVVSSPRWDNGSIVDAGAATFCNGTSGCTGVVSSANSLVGTTMDERVGYITTALTNGNYVAGSPYWGNGVGAVRWCDGTTGCEGVLSSANSLIGSSPGDGVGGNSFRNGVTALTNGNYVVNSPGWNNGASVDAGAVTFCNGTSGCTGAVSSANSLVGSTAAGPVGSVVVPLTNGNYVVGSLLWNNGAIMEAGAVTWCNGTSGCTGAVTSANSLVGSTAGDRIGSNVITNPDGERRTVTTITALPNGNYVVDSPLWDNGAIINAAAVTYGDGSDGTFGAITADNSVRGATSGCEFYCSLPYVFDAANNQLVVGRPLENIVTLFRKTGIPTPTPTPIPTPTPTVTPTPTPIPTPMFTPQAKITASDGAPADNFGYSVSISGNTAIVGVYGDDNLKGSAYIYVRNGAVWTQQQKLTASDGAAGDVFGESVSIFGDTAIVGARLDDVDANGNQGSAYIFVRSGNVWTQQQKLTASDGATGNEFGRSVSISGDTAVVGEPENDLGPANQNQGSAFIFVRSGSVWTQQQKINSSDGAAEDDFGGSVSISGDTAIIGAFGDDSLKGSAYIFVRNGNVWSEQQKLTASDGAAGNEFGRSVSISGDTVIIGEPENDLGPANQNQGSTFIFVRSGTVWSQQQKLNASDGAAEDDFGGSVTISGDTAIIGANGDDNSKGSSYIFARNGTVWTQQQKLTASDGSTGDLFGSSVSISGNTVITGANGDDNRRGSAYIFQTNATLTLGNYPNTTVTLGANTTITPDAAPNGATSINVSTDTNFKGIFAADPTTGVIRVTNAHPAGTYLVTVKAFKEGEMTTKTFTLTVVTGTACNGTVQFTEAPDIDINNNRLTLAIGDFNNDGNQDYAIASFFVFDPIMPNGGSGSRVDIRLGDGTGGFTAAPNVSVGASPTSIAIGDFNNDGNQDFATANVDSAFISIRLGDGAGNFNNAINVPRGDVRVFDIAIGDFNNDGNQDLAAGGEFFNNRTVAIRLGDGTGNFGGTTNIIVGGIGPVSVAIGDFNNDGNQDFAANAIFGDTVAIRLGDGTGNFSGTTQVIAGFRGENIAIGDFNNDGNQDFAIANGNNNTVSIRLGDGTGNFSGTTEVGAFAFSVAIGDFNNDGNQDIAGNTGGGVSILLGNGTGNFTNSGGVSVGGIAPSNIVVGDLNNDGNQDFATTSYSLNPFSISKVFTRLSSCLVTPTPSISGRVTYANSSSMPGVPFTTITAAGSIPLSTMTDSGGFYSLSGFGSGAYIFTPSKSNQVNGISNLDASAVAQHVAGLITLNPNQQIAADASGNGVVGALDAAYIAQFAASIPNPGITGQWKFLPASRSYPNVQSSQMNQDYSAILVGEVTGNWNPLGALGFELSAADSQQSAQTDEAAKEEGVSITADSFESAGEGTALTVNLTSADVTGKGLIAYQFDLLYDPKLIDPQSVSCDVSDTMSSRMTAICNVSEPGILKVVVYGTTPLTGEGTLLKLNFKAAGKATRRSALAVQNFMFNERVPGAITVKEQW